MAASPSGERHSVGFYDQRGEAVVLAEGDRFFVPCVGGPSTTRLEAYPPRLEIPERYGVYILVDEGPRDTWRYEFVPRGRNRRYLSRVEDLST